MRLAVVKGCNLDQFVCDGLQSLPEVDLIVLSFSVLGTLHMADEVEGLTSLVPQLVLLSKNTDSAVAAACRTNLYGSARRSAVVCDKGELVDIADMVHTLSEELDGGRRFRVYNLSCGKLGVLLCDDIYYCEAARALRIQGAELLLGMAAEDDARQKLLMRAHCLANGINGIYVTDKTDGAISSGGKFMRAAGGQVSIIETSVGLDDTFLMHRKKQAYVVGIEKY